MKVEFKKVFIEDIGKTLIHGKRYLCVNGSHSFTATFNCCSDEYWWIDANTGKLTGVSEYAPTFLSSGYKHKHLKG